VKVALGSDHGGLELKYTLCKCLADRYEIVDVGADYYNADDDYPDFAIKVAEAVLSKKAERGILVCGSGVGASIAANKITGIYAGLCHDTYSAHQGVEHDNMNVLCLGARVIGTELAYELSMAFLTAKFHVKEKRFVRRSEKVRSLENNH